MKKSVMFFFMFWIILISLSSVFSLDSESTLSTEWKMFGRFLNNTRYTNAINLPIINSTNITTFTALDNILSSPIVYGGYVYVGSKDDNLYQLNASNISQQIANFTTGGNVLSSPAIAGNYLYVGSNDNHLYQLNASNISHHITNFTADDDIKASPVVYNGYVYVGELDSGIDGAYLYQLNASNVTQEITKFFMGENPGGPGEVEESVAIANGYVYVGSGDSILHQLNASDMTEITNFTTGDKIVSSAVFTNNYIYVGSNDGYVYQLNASNINQEIARNYAIRVTAISYANNYLYVGNQDGALYQLNASNISLRSINFTLGDDFSESVITDHYVFVYSSSNPPNITNLYQLNVSNISNILGNYSMGSFRGTSPAVVDNYVYVGSSDNKTYMFGNLLISSDTTFPQINITFPQQNNTNISNINYNINFTYTETNPDSCWYSNDTYSINRSIPCSGANMNITNLTWSEGKHNITIWINDTSDNLNQTSISFTVDSTSPLISFSCSSTSVSSGEVITCSCSATDNVDSNPTVSYAVNPDTSSTGSFTTTCTAVDFLNNSASSDIGYTVTSVGGGSGGSGESSSESDSEESDLLDEEVDLIKDEINLTEEVCVENWKCDFSICGNNDEFSFPYNCVDLNDCGIEEFKPGKISCGLSISEESSEDDVVDSSDSSEENVQSGSGKGQCFVDWECFDWEECSAKYDLNDVLQGDIFAEGIQERKCVDNSGCVSDRTESKSCKLSIPISAKKVEWCFKDYIEIFDRNTNELKAKIKEEELEFFDFGRIDIIFSDSDIEGSCDYCFNGIQDYDEGGIDCGGSCEECVVFLEPVQDISLVVTGLWASLGLLFFAGGIIERKLLIRGVKHFAHNLKKDFSEELEFEKNIERKIIGFFKRVI